MATLSVISVKNVRKKYKLDHIKHQIYKYIFIDPGSSFVPQHILVHFMKNVKFQTLKKKISLIIFLEMYTIDRILYDSTFCTIKFLLGGSIKNVTFFMLILADFLDVVIFT